MIKNIFLKTPILKEYKINKSIDFIKNKLESDKSKSFYYKTLWNKEFQISLNFSFGSNLLIDANYQSKSDIKARGKFKELEPNLTTFKLETEYPYMFVTCLALMFFAIILGKIFIEPTIPIEFALLPILMFFGVGYFVNSEYERLFKNFDAYCNKLNSL
tara:strand:+ start:1003 stop:1479 length:477 start_codon:yes stop_codon:yes gene_type:complete